MAEVRGVRPTNYSKLAINSLRHSSRISSLWQLLRTFIYSTSLSSILLYHQATAHYSDERTSTYSYSSYLVVLVPSPTYSQHLRQPKECTHQVQQQVKIFHNDVERTTVASHPLKLLAFCLEVLTHKMDHNSSRQWKKNNQTADSRKASVCPEIDVYNCEAHNAQRDSLYLD